MAQIDECPIDINQLFTDIMGVPIDPGNFVMYAGSNRLKFGKVMTFRRLPKFITDVMPFTDRDARNTSWWQSWCSILSDIGGNWTNPKDKTQPEWWLNREYKLEDSGFLDVRGIAIDTATNTMRRTARKIFSKPHQYLYVMPLSSIPEKYRTFLDRME